MKSTRQLDEVSKSSMVSLLKSKQLYIDNSLPFPFVSDVQQGKKFLFPERLVFHFSPEFLTQISEQFCTQICTPFENSPGFTLYLPQGYHKNFKLTVVNSFSHGALSAMWFDYLAYVNERKESQKLLHKKSDAKEKVLSKYSGMERAICKYSMSKKGRRKGISLNTGPSTLDILLSMECRDALSIQTFKALFLEEFEPVVTFTYEWTIVSSEIKNYSLVLLLDMIETTVSTYRSDEIPLALLKKLGDPNFAAEYCQVRTSRFRIAQHKYALKVLLPNTTKPIPPMQEVVPLYHTRVVQLGQTSSTQDYWTVNKLFPQPVQVNASANGKRSKVLYQAKDHPDYICSFCNAKMSHDQTWSLSCLCSICFDCKEFSVPEFCERCQVKVEGCGSLQDVSRQALQESKQKKNGNFQQLIDQNLDFQEEDTQLMMSTDFQSDPSLFQAYEENKENQNEAPGMSRSKRITRSKNSSQTKGSATKMIGPNGISKDSGSAKKRREAKALADGFKRFRI